MSGFDDQLEIVFNEIYSSKYPHNYLRSLSPAEKIAKLIQLQDQYYQMLKIREENSGRPIPERWQKWYQARYRHKMQDFIT